MKHIWTVLCQNSSVDKETNLLSLFNCVEELTVKIDRTKITNISDSYIPVNINIQLISFWSIENPGKDNILKMKVELLDPKGKLITEFPQEINIKKGSKRFRHMLSIKGMKIKEEGRYIFKMNYQEKNDKKFKTVAELPVDVQLNYTL